MSKFRLGFPRLLATMAIGAVFWVTPAYAVHDDSIFQLDGDAFTSTCGTAFGGGLTCFGDDWSSLYTCPAGGGLGGCTKATPGVGNGAAAISDLVVDPAPASIFRGGGSKDEKNITQWNWTDGAVPDKDDLIEAFAALYLPTSGARSGHKILYFGANRLAVSGDAQIGVWFLQNSVSLKSDGTFQDAQGNPAQHKLGDILILSNFVQGGGSANVQVFKVVQITPGTCPAGSVETTAGAGDICLQQIVNGLAGLNGVCNPTTGTIPEDATCAATNGAVVQALDPDFIPKAGAAKGQYPVVGFFEGGLDLNAVNLAQECFPTFVVETRSSASITAVLKDFTIGSFQQCDANIRTEIHSAADNSDADLQGGSVRTGTSIHDLAIVTGTQGAPVPTGTVTFKLFGNLTCTGASTPQTVGLFTGGAGCPTGATCANSTAFTPAPGNVSYQATYNGDSNYPAPPFKIGNCEPLTINKFESSIATDILKVSNGSVITDTFIDLASAATVDVRDRATVTKFPANGGPTPTGSVTFQLFTNGNCTGTSTSETIALTGGTCGANPCGTSLSSIFALGANGLSYRATYSGDSNFLPTSTSRCEPVCAIDTTK